MFICLFAAGMLPVLHHFMQHPGKDYVDCRCRAIESAGIIVGALGAEDPVISPHINGMMEVALQGFSGTDSPDLRDHSHSMFANIAKALGENFAAWLPRVVPLAFESCKQEDGQVGDAVSSEDDDEELLSEDESDEEAGGRHFNVRTGEARCSCNTGAYVARVGCPGLAISTSSYPALSPMLQGWVRYSLVTIIVKHLTCLPVPVKRPSGCGQNQGTKDYFNASSQEWQQQG